MEVIVLQAVVSLLLVVGSLLLFGHLFQQRTHEHNDRMALAPLEDDAPRTDDPPVLPPAATRGPT